MNQCSFTPFILQKHCGSVVFDLCVWSLLVRTARETSALPRHRLGWKVAWIFSLNSFSVVSEFPSGAGAIQHQQNASVQLLMGLGWRPGVQTVRSVASSASRGRNTADQQKEGIGLLHF
jgi:hypothetical protein